jgi:hypothetical protein
VGFFVKLLYGVDLIRITKPAGEKRNTIDTLRVADVLFTKRSTKQDKYAVNPKLETFCDVSYRELFRRINVFLHNKICPFLRQGICNYVGHSILWNTIELIILICLLDLMGPRIYSVSHKCPSSCHLVIFDGFLNIHVTVINEPNMHCIYFIHYFFKLWFLLFAFCLSAMLSIETSLFITLFVMWEWSNVGSIWAQLKPHLWRWCEVVLPEVTWPEAPWGVFSGVRMRKRKLRNICPSWAFPR